MRNVQLYGVAIILALAFGVGCDETNGDEDAGSGRDSGGSDPDGGRIDSGPPVDGGRFDAGNVDSGSVDGGNVDGGNVDAPMSDAGTSTTGEQIAAVRAATDGTVDLDIDGAVVTYTKAAVGGSPADGAGFFLQADAAGPAIFVQIDPASLSPVAAVGQVVDLTVTEVADVQGRRTITMIESGSWSVESTGFDVTTLVQDATSVDLVTNLEMYESELIELRGTIVGATTECGTGFVCADITTAGVSTPTALFRLRWVEALGVQIGRGCTFDLGPTPLWQFDNGTATTQAAAWVAEDIDNIVCDVPAAGELVITEIGYQFTDADDDKEFVEIYNPSEDTSYQLEGCRLADGNGFTGAGSVAEEVSGALVIGPGEFVLFSGAVGTSGIDSDVEITGDLLFDDTDDTVQLGCDCTTDCATVVDSVVWSPGGAFDPATMDDFSVQLDSAIVAAPNAASANDTLTNWCRSADAATYGDFTPERRGTPGIANSLCECPDVSGLVINEIDYNQADGGGSADDNEFIELYNGSGGEIDLSNVIVVLHNGASDGAEYGRGTLSGTLGDGEYLLVVPTGSGATGGGADIVVMDHGSIQNGPDDMVTLYDMCERETIDFVSYGGEFDGTPTLADDTEVTITDTGNAGTDPNTGGESLQRIPNGTDTNVLGDDWSLEPTTAGVANEAAD